MPPGSLSLLLVGMLDMLLPSTALEPLVRNLPLYCSSSPVDISADLWVVNYLSVIPYFSIWSTDFVNSFPALQHFHFFLILQNELSPVQVNLVMWIEMEVSIKYYVNVELCELSTDSQNVSKVLLVNFHLSTQINILFNFMSLQILYETKSSAQGFYFYKVKSPSFSYQVQYFLILSFPRDVQERRLILI